MYPYSVGAPSVRSQDVCIVKRYNDEYYKLVWCASVRKKYFVALKEKDVTRTRDPTRAKLDNNLSRAKSRVYELAYCNDWDWFFTGTLSPHLVDYRYDLDKFIKDFGIFLQNYNIRNSDYKVKYLLIPEQHDDGAWHLHGLLKGINPKDIVINSNGYLEWRQYRKKFGYMSFEDIRSVYRVAGYITKYVNKATGEHIAYCKHSYYCSKGLKRAEELFRGHFDTDLIDWDYTHENLTKGKVYSDLEFLQLLTISDGDR